jgi:hypothetical protein
MASDLVRSGPIEPQTLSELKDLASNFAASGLFGNLSPQQALVISLAGRDLGFSYTQALRAFSIIKGKPTLTADGMVAAALARGVCEYFRPIEQTDERAVWETRRVGAEPVRYSFTMQDAERAGLISDMYRRHPRRMLSARAKAYLARDVYPEILLGLVTEDEAEEISRSPRPTAPTRPAPVVVEAVPVVESAPAGPVGPSLYERIQSAATVEDLASLWRASASERQSMSIDEQAQVKAVFAERKGALGGTP